MKVILDTNVFVSDFHMNGTTFRVMFDGLERAGVQIVVPRVILEEVVNKYREELQEIRRELDRQLGRLKRLTATAILEPLNDAQLAEQVETYRKLFVRKLRSVGAEFSDYPRVPHEVIVDRELTRKKPFSEKGSGYRDFLIWHSILQVTGQHKPVAFVTENKRDFASEDGSLHPHLVADMLHKGLDASAITLFLRLDDFVNSTVRKELESLHDILTNLRVGKYQGLDIEAELEQGLNDAFIGRELSPREAGFRRDYTGLTVTSVDDIVEFEVSQVQRLPSGELLVSIDAEVECEFEFLMDKSTYLLMEQEQLPARLPGASWKDHYVTASDVETVGLHVELTYDQNRRSVTSFNADVVPRIKRFQRKLHRSL